MDPYRQPPPVATGLPCPRCDGTLLPVREGGHEFRRCSWCQGVWIQADTLKKALGDRRLARTPSGFVDDGQTVRCPAPQEWRQRTTVRTKPRIIVDVCEHGVGLDRGEFDVIVTKVEPGTDPLP